jgi:hypothetical protein
MPTPVSAPTPGMPLDAGQVAAPSGSAYPAIEVPPKKGSKAKFFIIGGAALVVIALVVLLIVGLTTGFFGGTKSPLQALTSGSEKLVYEVGSATAEFSMAGGGIEESLTLKWEFGKDFASSTIWFDVKGEGVIIQNDTA